MPGKHATSLVGGSVVFRSDLGEVTRVTAADLPILKGLSIKRLVLTPGAVRAPHWHANCAELAYCIRGRALVSLLGNESRYASFEVSAGQMFFIESGFLHTIESVGDKGVEFIIAFGHESPEDFMLQGAFGAMTPEVLGNTYGLPAEAFRNIPRTTEGAYIVARSGPAVVPTEASRPTPFRFDVEAQSAPIELGYGEAKLARKQFWPLLDGMAMYSLRMTPDGMREPHWHPGTAEMGYVAEGRARMTLLSPDGTTDTWDLTAGDVYFIPPAYPHHIEVLDGKPIHFLIFFDQSAPGDVGFKASLSALSRPVAAAMLGVVEAQLPTIPTTVADPLIVQRVNPGERSGQN